MKRKEMDEIKRLIEGFIHTYGTGHGLDQRTEKAYRMDLELFCSWAGQEETCSRISAGQPNQDDVQADTADVKHGELEDWMEAYLDYLRTERKLSFSTLYRKNRVLSYYLSYLEEQGILSGSRKLKPVAKSDKPPEPSQAFHQLLSKKDTDAFFAAMKQEYERLESDFRKRICLRDMVMMELLFFHKIEISELLQIEITDYHRETEVLTIRRKKGETLSIRLYSQELLQKLRLWLNERKEFLINEEYNNRMFLSKFGKPLSMEMLIHIFDKYRTMAGIEKKFTPKDLKESSMKQYARELMMERCS